MMTKKVRKLMKAKHIASLKEAADSVGYVYIDHGDERLFQAGKLIHEVIHENSSILTEEILKRHDRNE